MKCEYSVCHRSFHQVCASVCDTETNRTSGRSNFMENFLVHYGWPEKILTDQGKSFENSLVRELCELAQVKKLRSSPYQPETNGQCEHFDTTLINMMGTLPTLAKKNWQQWIATLTHAYHCTVSSVTGFSPYFFNVWTYSRDSFRCGNGGDTARTEG